MKCFFVFAILFSFNLKAIPQFLVKPTNPYYVTKEGSAELINGEHITGKFYYHSPPFSDNDSFYFYPTDINSRQIIKIKEFKYAEFKSKNGETIRFTMTNGKLQRKLKDGNSQVLNTKVLRQL